MNQQATKQNELSRRILESTITLFEQKGISGTTMEDIAQSAAVTRRTVYRYFPSKQAVLRAAAEQNASKVITRMQAEVPSDLPFLEYITECIIFLVDTVPNEPFYQLQARGEAEMQSRNIYFTFPPLYEKWLDVFQKPYVAALRQRIINPELELSDIIMWVGRICFSYLQFPSPNTSADDMRREISLYFINALKHDA